MTTNFRSRIKSERYARENEKRIAAGSLNGKSALSLGVKLKISIECARSIDSVFRFRRLHPPPDSRGVNDNISRQTRIFPCSLARARLFLF
jgi:hypothetical protein